MNSSYICIEGNIGTGKTTLCKMLAERLNGRLILEEFAENPFLERFYIDPAKYAFPLEMAFMADRYRQLKELTVDNDLFQPITVADYSPSKSLIFAGNNLEGREFLLYREFFEIIFNNLRKPDLIIYLYRPISELLKNIKNRGREYEQKIGEKYLSEIDDSYRRHFKQNPTQKVLYIDISGLDFINEVNNYLKLEQLILDQIQNN